MQQPVISHELWERARTIFERKGHQNEVWGDSAARQTHTFFERQHHETETQTVVGEEARAEYLEIARAELEYEASLDQTTVGNPR